MTTRRNRKNQIGKEKEIELNKKGSREGGAITTIIFQNLYMSTIKTQYTYPNISDIYVFRETAIHVTLI